MKVNEHTIASPLFFEGKGLHTGVYTRMRVLPSQAGSGIVFRRTDLKGCPEIPALAEYVTNTARSTTISCGEAEAVTIEHIMSALTGMGIDNAVVELDNREVPILDGSARKYIEAILKAGTVDLGVERVFIDLPYDIEISNPETGSSVRLERAQEPSADITVDFGSKVLGLQKARWDLSTDYAKEIGICRTFVFFHEIEYLYNNNLVKGGDVDNAIVIDEHGASREQLDHIAKLFGLEEISVKDGYLSNLTLSFPDECGRHKLLDLLGDLRLAGGFINARITAFKPGHGINTKAAKALRATLK